nr:helix-turn-helix domain-containing protein [Clostridium paraputrificum]
MDLADRLNTSQQNISAKLKRNNFSVKEMEQIAEVLGYNLEITFTKKE